MATSGRSAPQAASVVKTQKKKTRAQDFIESRARRERASEGA
jgi:hypothetical protein